VDSGYVKLDPYEACYLRFLEGDECGFTELVESLGEKLIFFINRFVNDPALAEDLMEDTFCEILVHKNRFRGQASFQTYLFAIAHNKAVDAIRKNIREQRRESLAAWEPDETVSFEERMCTDQRKTALHQAISRLNEEYQAVLHLIYFEELSYDEAAIVLKKNNRQIKNLVYRAKQTLKTLVEGEAIFDEDFAAMDR